MLGVSIEEKTETLADFQTSMIENQLDSKMKAIQILGQSIVPFKPFYSKKLLYLYIEYLVLMHTIQWEKEGARHRQIQEIVRKMLLLLQLFL